MKAYPKVALIFILGTVVSLAGLLCLSNKIQAYRVQKIDFIINDREHSNVAELTGSDLIRYVEACGASTIKSGDKLQISYNGVFVQKKWVADLTVEKNAEQDAPH